MIQVNNVFYSNIDDYISNNTKYPILQPQCLEKTENITLVIAGLKIKIKDQDNNGRNN